MRREIFGAVLLTAIAFALGCPARSDADRDFDRLEQLRPASINDTVADTSAAGIGDTIAEIQQAAISVFYGTDRARTHSTDPAKSFGSKRGRLSVGTVTVSIPVRRHRPGQLESPSWRSMEVASDPRKHIVVLNLVQLDSTAWLRAAGTQALNGRQGVFVYIHGFNVKFGDAARRTAQIAYDLGFDGVPAFFSWPSQGSGLGYIADEATIERSIPYLRRFLLNFVAKTGAREIHLVAHSMGNRALTAFLKDLAISGQNIPISNVILAAPDIDAEVFEQQIVPKIMNVADRLTLYASSRDRALRASMVAHRYRRAGQSGDSIVVSSGMQSIDASRVDTDLLGHGYFAENKSLLDDIFMLLKHRLPAEERNLQARKKGDLPYWAFR